MLEAQDTGQDVEDGIVGGVGVRGTAGKIGAADRAGVRLAGFLLEDLQWWGVGG